MDVFAYCSIDCSGTLMVIFWIIDEDINRLMMACMTKQLSSNAHEFACEFNATLGLILTTKAQATVTCTVVRGLILSFFSSLG